MPDRNSGIFGLEMPQEEAKIVLLASPWEPTVSYGKGTANAPKRILEESHQVDLFDAELGHFYEKGIFLEEENPEVLQLQEEASVLAAPIIEACGVTNETKDDAAKVDELSKKCFGIMQQKVSEHLANDRIVGLLGGDHSSTLGIVKAYSEKYPDLGVLQIDAHADLRSEYEGFRYSHACIGYNILEESNISKLVQVGVRDICHNEKEVMQNDRVHTFFEPALRSEQFNGKTWAEQCKEIAAALPNDVYITCDIDGLDPSLCPHTGTPVPGGLSFAEFAYLVKTLVEQKKRIVGFDLCEVGNDQWDANVGARILFKLCGWTLASQG